MQAPVLRVGARELPKNELTRIVCIPRVRTRAMPWQVYHMHPTALNDVRTTGMPCFARACSRCSLLLLPSRCACRVVAGWVRAACDKGLNALLQALVAGE
jgi:hypothetical protein